MTMNIFASSQIIQVPIDFISSGILESLLEVFIGSNTQKQDFSLQKMLD